MANVERRKVSGLHLCVRPMEGDIMEVVVFDNELAHLVLQEEVVKGEELRKLLSKTTEG